MSYTLGETELERLAREEENRLLAPSYRIPVTGFQPPVILQAPKQVQLLPEVVARSQPLPWWVWTLIATGVYLLTTGKARGGLTL